MIHRNTIKVKFSSESRLGIKATEYSRKRSVFKQYYKNDGNDGMEELLAMTVGYGERKW